MIRASLIFCALAALAAGIVFAVRPDLDLAASAHFYLGGGKFSGETPSGLFWRRIFYWAPAVILVGAFGLWLANRRWGWPRNPPAGRTLLYLALSFALAPGVMANLILKDNWHRPRPVQVAEFGGPMEFRPWHRMDGGCKRNCSFVSGEGAAAFWTVAPAIMTPAPIRPLAVAAALAFGATTSALRMAFGGHFLSDVIFAALFTMLIVLGLHRVMFSPKRAPKSG